MNALEATGSTPPPDSRLHLALRRLPPEYQRVIRMRRLERRPVGEVALALGCTVHAVLILHLRAVKALAHELKLEDWTAIGE